jgi:hypothetical protein
MNPALGNPLTFYEEFVMKYDESYKNAAKAQKKAEKEARTLAARALMELTNKRKCHELEQSTRNKQSKTSELTTSSQKQQETQVLDITPGSYVCVEPDLSPGKCSHGGNVFITDINGDSVLRTFTVKYDTSGSSGGKTESKIPYSHLTVVPSPFACYKLARDRRLPEVMNIQAPQPPATPTLTKIQDILAAGASRGKHKGWRANELGVVEHGRRNERFNILLCEDTKEQLGFISGQTTAGNTAGASTRHNKKGRNGRFSKRAIKHNPHTILYLAKAWVLGKTFHWRILKKVQPW